MRIWALVKRILQQILRDKRTMALVLVAPIFIITLMYFLFNGETDRPTLGVVNVDQSLYTLLKEVEIDVIEYKEATDETIVEDSLDGLLSMENEQLQLTLLNSDPATAKALQMKVSQAVSAQAQAKLINKAAVSIDMSETSIDTKYVYGSSDTDFFDVLSPILVGFFVFFFVFLISGIGLLRERTTGTLERLMSTPIRRGEIVVAYLAGYGIVAVIQTVIVVLYSVNVLGMVLVGSIWIVLLINLLLALVALSLGILLSTFAASEFQMIQFIPVVVVPQVFFAGIFPLEGMANWLQAIGKIMPIYYAADALKGVMYKGFTLSEISGNIFVLIIFAVVFIVLNIFALKKHRAL